MLIGATHLSMFSQYYIYGELLCCYHTIAILTRLECDAASFRLQKRSGDPFDGVLPSHRVRYLVLACSIYREHEIALERMFSCVIIEIAQVYSS